MAASSPAAAAASTCRSRSAGASVRESQRSATVVEQFRAFCFRDKGEYLKT